MTSFLRLDFDPTTTILGTQIRLETLAIAAVVFLVMVLTAIAAGRAATIAADGETTLPRLRRDDLILVAFGAVPGAVVGGRAGYALVHLDYYRAFPAALFDPGQGGLSLTLAVVLGTITAMAVARLLAAPVRRWLGASALPVLFGLGLGKLAMVLGGAGQGSYSDASYATSYVGAGPWESANASYPALPSQAIEGLAVLALAVAVFVLPGLLRLRLRRWRAIVRPGLAPRRDWMLLTGGRRYLTLVGLWGIIRLAGAFTWRDASVLGPLRTEQLVLVPIILVALFGPAFVGAVGSSRLWLRNWRAARRERLAKERELAAIAAEVEALATKEAADREAAEKAAAEAQAAADAQAAAEAQAATDAQAAADAQTAADAAAGNGDDAVAGQASGDPVVDPVAGLTFDDKAEQSVRGPMLSARVEPG